jgi:hypothetical protein
MDGSKYDGMWKEDKRNGLGSFPFTNIGKYYYSNADKYDGEWKDDKRHGRGKLVIST